MDSDAPTLQIQLLGELRVTLPGDQPARFETRRAATLLAFLALRPNRAHPRDELIEMLWPDEDADATRIRFRQVLTTLRRTLECPGLANDSVLLADRASVRLQPGRTTTDAILFESAIKAASRAQTLLARVDALSAAASHYGGDLLPGHYDDWIVSERRRLEEAYLQALTELAEATAETGDFAAAVEHARKAIGIDPLREEAHAGLIRLYIAAGKASDALRQYRNLEQLLWKELRATPAPDLHDLVEPLRAFGAPAGARVVFASPSATPVAAPTDFLLPADLIQPSPAIAASTLSAALTRFFGRDIETENLIQLLICSARLITVLGIAGAGKSRVAIEAARRVQPAYPGGVILVNVTEANNPAELVSAIASKLELPGSDSAPSIADCAAQFGDGPSLLILDDFEHLVDSCDVVVQSLLERAPNLTCLVTSRRRLGLDGEQELHLDPLPVPTEGDGQLAADYPSVALFANRAQKADAGFSLTEANTETVGAICRRLEGIPLAIELAAAWSGVLTPGQILDRLERRFDLLVSRRKQTPPRHRSMLTAVEGSYKELEPEVQQFAQAIGIFSGGWTLAGAESVSGDVLAVDRLAQLGEHSLIMTALDGEETRFGMLDTVRDYVISLPASSHAQEYATRHAFWYLALSEEARPRLTRVDQIAWLHRLDSENSNLQIALGYFQSTGQFEEGLRLATALSPFWEARSRHAEGRQWLDTFLTESTGMAPHLRAEALTSAADFARAETKIDYAREKAAEAIELFKAQNDKQGLAGALCVLSETLSLIGETAQAATLLDEAQGTFERMRNYRGAGRALVGKARCEITDGEIELAAQNGERSAAMYRIAGHIRGLASSLALMGSIAQRQDDAARATSLLQEALALFRQLDDHTSVQRILSELDELGENAGE